MLSKKVKDISIFVVVLCCLLLCVELFIRSAYLYSAREPRADMLPDDTSTEAYEILSIVQVREFVDDSVFKVLNTSSVAQLEAEKGYLHALELSELHEQHEQERAEEQKIQQAQQAKSNVPSQGSVVQPVVPTVAPASPGDASAYNGTALTNEELAAIGISASDFTAVCCVVYSEIRGGSYSAIANVVNVIRNRVYSGSFPNSYSGVCYQSGQFVVGKMPGESLQRTVYSALYAGDTTGGALYFCTCLNCGRGKSHTLLFQDDAGHYFWK